MEKLRKIFGSAGTLLKKQLPLIIIALILSLAVGGFAKYKYSQKELKIGFITDIHAGSQDYRDEGVEENNILLPSNFEKNLRQVLTLMKKEGVDIIISLGDNLNRPSKKYLQKLKSITSGYPIIWTKGNHDKKVLFQELSPQRYYYMEKKNWRIIILDNSETDPDNPGDNMNNHGYIYPEEKEWLKNDALKTEKKVVVAMHVPMFKRAELGQFREDQLYLKKIFEESGNVRYVLAGHFHVYDWNEKINGIDYYILPSLELKDQEGYYMTLKLSNGN